MGQDVDAMMATDEAFLLGAWLKKSRAVSDWDGSGGALAGFYEWNSRVQVPHLAQRAFPGSSSTRSTCFPLR